MNSPHTRNTRNTRNRSRGRMQQAPAPWLASRAHALCTVGLVASIALALAFAARAQAPQQAAEPERIRGEITRVEPAAISLRTADGKTVRIGVNSNLTVFTLAKASFAEVDFGTYVGSASYKMGDNIYSPIVRDSLSWLHKGYELRIIDESLRGIAVGHTKWDLTAVSVMTHGWVDVMEGRVMSIKFGPTEEEETDVEVARDAQVVRMSLGDKSLIKPGLRVLAGAQKGADGNYVGVFIFVGKDGIVPAL